MLKKKRSAYVTEISWKVARNTYKLVKKALKYI